MILETNSLQSALTLAQDDKSTTVEQTTAYIHVDSGESHLRIYVPASCEERDFCFAAVLPASLADWLMTHPVTQRREAVDPGLINILIAVLSLDPSNVDHLLERHVSASLARRRPVRILWIQNTPKHSPAKMRTSMVMKMKTEMKTKTKMTRESNFGVCVKVSGRTNYGDHVIWQLARSKTISTAVFVGLSSEPRRLHFFWRRPCMRDKYDHDG